MARLPAAEVLGRNVRRLRLSHGWDQATFAQEIGWHARDIEKLEAGLLELDLDSVDDLSSALGTQPSLLFAGQCEEIIQTKERCSA